MIEGYATEDVEILFARFADDEVRRWAWHVLECLKEYFPDADHYVTGGKEKKYIDIRVGIRRKGSQRGTPFFFLWHRDGGARLWAHNERVPDACLGKNDRGLSFKENPELEEIDAWFATVRKRMQKEKVTIKGYGLVPSDYGASDVADESEMPEEVERREEGSSTCLSQNMILFGPPGTGKTYNAITEAVRILDPDLLSQPGVSRDQINQSFRNYQQRGQVEFCTFHQSFSYEEFVEGLKAISEDGVLEYRVEDGIFKKLCQRAIDGFAPADDPFDRALARLREQIDESEGRIGLKTKSGRAFSVEYAGGATFLVFPQQSVSQKAPYRANLNLVRRLYQTGNKEGIYNISYVEAMLQYLQKECGLPPRSEVVPKLREKERFVLIIDEINRGSVSRIFGELITLIESSKRAGATEALSVVLPYSKDTFSVPDNVYLIGTMNTADRSLAGLDIALRRRFVFREMPPQPELLKGVTVEGIDIGRLLSVLNQRIEVLLDRDHFLGHAYFLPLKQEPTFDRLSGLFRDQILPLLQEYFFEDWERIRWVLNDQEAPAGVAPFIRPSAASVNLEKLFGSKAADLGGITRWQLNPEVFESAASFRNILGQP